MLVVVIQHKLDACSLRDRAARQGNATASYAFSILADELTQLTNELEEIHREEEALAAARAQFPRGGQGGFL
jgi:preprotein translocase subunit SecA